MISDKGKDDLSIANARIFYYGVEGDQFFFYCRRSIEKSEWKFMLILKRVEIKMRYHTVRLYSYTDDIIVNHIIIFFIFLQKKYKFPRDIVNICPLSRK